MFRLVTCSVLAFACGCERAPRTGPPDPAPAVRVPEPECRIDDDCTLMPAALTCCGDCDAVPPFEAVPHQVVDAALIELETRCAEKTSWCEPPVCEALPQSCEAYAACVSGHCIVLQSESCTGLRLAMVP